MFQIIGLSLLVIWSLGLLAPYTITGFIQIMLMTAILNYLLKKINTLNLLKTKLYKKMGFSQ
jgi:hypothetical protein